MEEAIGDGFTSLRLLRSMFSEYRLASWHIVSSQMSNQRLIVDFKFYTGRHHQQSDRSSFLGPSTLFCMQIVKQLYTYLRIRQWTIVSGDRETETIHFSFTFEFKKDVSRLPSSCLKPRRHREHTGGGGGGDPLSQVMGIMRDLEQMDIREERSSNGFLKSTTTTNNTTSGAMTANTDGDSLMMSTPPLSRNAAWLENEFVSEPFEHPSLLGGKLRRCQFQESDANDPDELANWRMGVCLQSSPYGGCSSSLVSSANSSYRSRSAIRRPIARRALPGQQPSPFQSICTSSGCPSNMDETVPSPPNAAPPAALSSIGDGHLGKYSRSRSAVTAAPRFSIRGVESHPPEIDAHDRVEPCFLRRPLIGERGLVGKRKEGGVTKVEVNGSVKARGGNPSSSSFNPIAGETIDPTQCPMCKKPVDAEDKRCENCKRTYCGECIWWCVISKRQRCLMCYSGG